MVIGAGAWWSGAQAELTHLVEATGMPFFTRNAGRGIIPDAHPLYVSVGYNHPVLRQALGGADLAVVVGTRPGFTLSREIFPPGLPIIRLDIDPAEVTNQLAVTVPLVGDVAQVAAQLSQALARQPVLAPAAVAGWVSALQAGAQQAGQMMALAANSDATPIHPLRLMAEIAGRIDADTIVVLDGGDVATWGVLALPAPGPGQTLGIAHNSFGPLGVGMGYAMAAKLAHPDKKVIHLTGDGAFGYGAMEYDTCLRYGLDITTIILNDAQWGMIKRSEAKKSASGEFVGLDLAATHYERVVESLGGYGEFVTQPGDLGPAIDRALASGQPACVNVMTDPQYGPPSP
jgi:acetolactate synthase-1/2/3 large subunit